MKMSSITCVYLIVIFCFFYFCDGFISIEMDTIEAEFLKKKEAFTGKDELETCNRSQRKTICDTLFKTRIYRYRQYISNMSALQAERQCLESNPPPDNVQSQDYNRLSPPTDKSYLEYNERKMEIATDGSFGPRSINVKIFPCIWDTKKSVEVFITHGFQLNHAYVIMKPMEYDDFALYVVRTIEPSAILSTSYKYPGTLGMYFWDICIAEGEPTTEVNIHFILPPGTGLCITNEYQHFRICSTVADTLRKFPNLQLDIKKNNFMEKITQSCVVKTVIDEQRQYKAEVEALPCAINGDKNNVQFYLIRDPKANPPTSVFVLQPERETNNLKVLAMVEHVLKLNE